VAGVVVGYATVMASPTFRGTFSVDLEGRVRPDLRGQGIGRALLAGQIARGPMSVPSGSRRHPAP
jgi:mycothiol synthase